MKIYKIKCCKECPKVDYTFKMAGTKHNYIICTAMSNKEMDNDNTLPKWCPLEDYNEKEGKK